MIKLVDILNEMAISNAWSGDRAKLPQETDVVINAAKQMGLNNPIIWRGTKGVKVPWQKQSILTYIMHVTPRVTTVFRGGTRNARKVLEIIGVKNPIFAHFDRALTEFFGTPCAIVLEKPYKIYQSTKYKDIMADTDDWETTEDNDPSSGGRGTSRTSRFKEKTEQDLQNIADTYQEIGGTPLYENREIIIDAASYWAMPCGPEIKTYGDLVDLLESYKVEFPIK